MRLIDADAMHKFVEDRVAEGKDGWKNGVPYEWAYALTAVDMQPTVDAAPVRHGRWIFDSGVDYCEKCSECKALKPPHYISDNYCPGCGAKMDGENEWSDG